MTTCIAIRLTSASEYGHSDWKDGTIAYQCDKDATQGEFCGICKRHKGAFGVIGKSYTWGDGTKSTVPEFALKKGTMDDEKKTKVDKGEALYSVFANPLMDDCGEMLVDNQTLLDADYWEDEDYDDADDEDDDEDDGEDDGEDDDEEDDDDDSSSSDDYKGVSKADLRKDLEGRELSTTGLKAALVTRLVNNDNGTDDDEDDEDEKPKKTKKTRKPTAYNLFMKKQLIKYKKKNKDDSHQDAFAACAAMWTKQKTN